MGDIVPLVVDYTEYGKNFKLNKPEKIKGFEPVAILFVKERDINENDPISTLDKIKNSHLPHQYIYYNTKKGICWIKPTTPLEITNPGFPNGLPENTVWWVCFEIEKVRGKSSFLLFLISKFISAGFRDPYISEKSITHQNIPKSLCMVKSSRKGCFSLDESSIRNKVKVLLENADLKTCPIELKISPETIQYLQKTSRLGYVAGAQRELTGELRIIKVDRNGVFIIGLAPETVKHGEAENVNVEPTRYNFHSHPEQAYIRHSVSKAWPSVTDFLGYHQLGENTICHFVATLEGLYILSFSEYWGKQLGKVSRRFISNHFEIDHKTGYSPEQFVSKVNSILFKEYPIYEVKFFPWGKAESTFSVYFPPIGKTCLITGDNLKNHEFFFGENK